jgi:hypothetical protein
MTPLPGTGQLVDRWGNKHSESVFTHWSPAAIKALGITRLPAQSVPAAIERTDLTEPKGTEL